MDPCRSLIRYLISDWLRHDLLVSLAADNIHHHAVWIDVAACYHWEDSWCASAYECHTLLIHCHRLLSVTALDVPEHHARKLVASLCEDFFRILAVNNGEFFIIYGFRGDTSIEKRIELDIEYIEKMYSPVLQDLDAQLKNFVKVGNGVLAEFVKLFLLVLVLIPKTF